MNCQWPKCGCAEREQCKPEDALKAALARAEAAEEARDKYEKLATDLYHARAEAERQRDEAPDLLAAYRAALARAEAAERRLAEYESWRGDAETMTKQLALSLADASVYSLGNPIIEKKAIVVEAFMVAMARAAEDAEHQRGEAWTAGAEAMREACAQASEGEAYGFPPEQLTEHGQGYDRACKEIAAILRALPIPAQEVK